jgi:hypothetical protein
MIIEIDDDCVDGIVQGAILKDYIYLTNDLKLEKKLPGHLHPDDYKAYKEVVCALEVLGGWYFIDFKSAVKAARKKK